MDEFFKTQDAIQKLHQNLKKNARYTRATKHNKIKTLLELKTELKQSIQKLCLSQKSTPLIKKYQELRGIIVESILILKGENLDSTLGPGEKSIAITEEEIASDEVEEGEEEYESLESLDSNSDSEFQTMAPKLDLSLALKVVKPFDGCVTDLTRYIENVELLKDYAEEVPEAAILEFLKTTFVGAAHGAIDNSTTIAQALQALR